MELSREVKVLEKINGENGKKRGGGVPRTAPGEVGRHKSVSHRLGGGRKSVPNQRRGKGILERKVCKRHASLNRLRGKRDISQGPQGGAEKKGGEASSFRPFPPSLWGGLRECLFRDRHRGIRIGLAKKG